MHLLCIRAVIFLATEHRMMDVFTLFTTCIFVVTLQFTVSFETQLGYTEISPTKTSLPVLIVTFKHLYTCSRTAVVQNYTNKTI